MSRLRKVSSRALLAGAAAVSLAALVGAAGPATLASASSSGATRLPLSVTWMSSYAAPETPSQYDKVGVLKIGPSSAKNVLVLEPGTSAGSAYFVPLAKWIVSKTPGWQVWSVERRENLLEDQSELNLFKEGKATATQLFDYYLGYIKDPTVTHHFQMIPNSTVEFAKSWGMNVAVQDLHTVIAAARKLGGKVVLGGHSLGGTVVTAYATWDFNGKPGADQLSGLVYIDGASSPTPEALGAGGTPAPMTAALATQELQALDQPSVSPWLSFGGITAPYAGLFNATGSAAALLDPNAPSLGQTSGLLPTDIVPPVRVSNVGQYGYALNVATSPPVPRGGTSTPRRRCVVGRPDPRVERYGSADADHAVRHHVLGRRGTTTRTEPSGTSRSASPMTQPPSPTAMPTRPRACSMCTPPWATTCRTAC